MPRCWRLPTTSSRKWASAPSASCSSRPAWCTTSSTCSRAARPTAGCEREVQVKVLVTGAAGFIGSCVARKLLARGDEVVGLDNLNAYYDPKLKEARLARLLPQAGFRFVKLDLADAAGMAALFQAERFDRVVHLAAQAGVRYSLE